MAQSQFKKIVDRVRYFCTLNVFSKIKNSKTPCDLKKKTHTENEIKMPIAKNQEIFSSLWSILKKEITQIATCDFSIRHFQNIRN